MIPLERTAAVLLAAGQSVRFGGSNKLNAPLRGRPLASYAAGQLRGLPFLARIAVIGSAERSGSLGDLLRAHGFDLVENPVPETGLDSSARLGLARALATGADAVLICLADMPQVTRAHFCALSASVRADLSAISSTGEHRSPPTLVPRSIAQRILANPEQPVRALINPATEVAASSLALADVDTAADLARIEEPE